MPNVILPLADGCEELEAITVVDLLRRAGITVITAGLEQRAVKTAHGVRLTADTCLEEVIYDDFDMVVLPGGMPGTLNLNNDPHVHAIIKRLYQANKAIAAICAAPVVLATIGLLDGRHVSCYPNAIDDKAWPNIILCDDPVVIDGPIITSRGPGTAIDFALTLIEYLTDKSQRLKVEAELVR